MITGLHVYRYFRTYIDLRSEIFIYMYYIRGQQRIRVHFANLQSYLWLCCFKRLLKTHFQHSLHEINSIPNLFWDSLNYILIAFSVNSYCIMVSHLNCLLFGTHVFLYILSWKYSFWEEISFWCLETLITLEMCEVSLSIVSMQNWKTDT